jgi:hypothetical protein
MMRKTGTKNSKTRFVMIVKVETMAVKPLLGKRTSIFRKTKPALKRSRILTDQRREAERRREGRGMGGEGGHQTGSRHLKVTDKEDRAPMIWVEIEPKIRIRQPRSTSYLKNSDDQTRRGPMIRTLRAISKRMTA